MRKRNLKFKRTFLVVLIALTVVFASVTDVHAGKALRKGIKGAAAGALIGAAFGGSDGAAKGAMIGGGVGLIAGSNDKNKRKKHKNRAKHHKRRR